MLFYFLCLHKSTHPIWKDNRRSYVQAWQFKPRDKKRGQDGAATTNLRASLAQQNLLNKQLFRMTEKLESSGIQTSFFYGSLLRDCKHPNAFAVGKCIHSHILSSGYAKNMFLKNLLIQMYAKCDSLDDARLLFDRMDERNTFTWTILLRAYSQHGQVQDACWLFNKMPERNVVSWNTIITAYAQHGCLQEAHYLFERMPEKSLVSWNTMIASFAWHGHSGHAFMIFKQMLYEGGVPNEITFVSMLGACTHAGDVASAEGKRIHSYILTKGFKLDIVMGTALINMYAKCGNLEDARRLFKRTFGRDMVSWNAMIAAYALHGHSQEALNLFNKMTEHNTVSWNAMISAFANCGQIEEAYKMFQQMPKRDVVSWNSIIAAYAQSGDYVQVVQHFHQMQSAGIRSNEITFVSILDVCTSQTKLSLGKVVHAFLVLGDFEADDGVRAAIVNMYGRCGSLKDARLVLAEMHLQASNGMPSTFHGMLTKQVFERKISAWNAMITSYGEHGQVEEALQVFQQMTVRNVVSWNAIIAAYAQNQDAEEALNLFQKMQLEKMTPDKITFVSILGACSGEACLSTGVNLHEQIKCNDFVSDTVVGTAIVTMYGKCGSLKYARMTFDKIIEQDVVLWNAMIAVYIQREHGQEALELFQDMRKANVIPNKVTLVNILSVCATLAALAEGRRLHSYIIEGGFDLDLVMGNSLVNMYAKSGNLEDAYSIFKTIPGRDVVSWNAMITAYAQHGYNLNALQIFQAMGIGGIMPDNISLIGVLSACSHVGEFNVGCHFFSSSESHHITPNIEHYQCIIDLLGRIGWLDEAEDFVNGIPFDLSFTSLMTLLAACKVYFHLNRATRVANHVLDLNPLDLAPYVLVSNIYAAAGMWEEALRVRKMMRDKCSSSFFFNDVEADIGEVNVGLQQRRYMDENCMFA